LKRELEVDENCKPIGKEKGCKGGGAAILSFRLERAEKRVKCGSIKNLWERKKRGVEP